jgi:hypothetical protein
MEGGLLGEEIRLAFEVQMLPTQALRAAGSIYVS